MSLNLHVVGSGMCCAVGWTAPAARAAIRAGIDRFAESEFLDTRGEPIIVARMPIGDVWGVRRLVMMFEAAMTEATASAERLDPARTALLLIVAEHGRAGSSEAWAQGCVRACESRFGRSLHPASAVLPCGRAGIARALQHASSLLEQGTVGHIIVAGVDTYLNAQTINHFLRHGRILASDTKDGFIPAEGAGALLLARAAGGGAGLHVHGVGLADETATIDAELPSRADGLTAAIREALKQSGRRVSDLHFRMGDIAGESFFFREAGNAVSRAFDRPVAKFPLLHITDSIGEAGAAVGPLSLAFLKDAMLRGHVPGTRALLHFSNDGPARAALIVEHRTA